jgi:hypothetical protein
MQVKKIQIQISIVKVAMPLFLTYNFLQRITLQIIQIMQLVPWNDNI